MNQTVRNIILISGIIPATFLFLLSIFWLFQFITDIFYDWETFILILCFSFGILGYFGLWRNLVLSKKRVKLNSYLLGFGIIGCLTFIIFEGGERAIKWIISFEEPLENLMLIWPLIVSVIVLILNLKTNEKYKSHNKE